MDFTRNDYNLIDKEFEELKLASLKRCSSQEEYDGIIKAFEFANEAHKGVRRRSGEPYIIHSISVAKIVVTEIGLGYKSIVTALLHDVVEDTQYTVEDIRRLFGEKIASLVDGLTKIKAAMDKKGNNLQAENFKRIILTLNDDVRVVLIKLADRLHNLRTIDSMPDYKKGKILSETMYIFIPLAHRLGLYNMKSEMENIWLKTVNPDEYEKIIKQINEVIEQKGEAMNRFIKPISDALTDDGFSFRICKRTKTPFSVWNKIQNKGIPFEDIYDIYGVRIIFKPKPETTERSQCWQIYSLISGIYPSKTDRLRDWAERPKTNGYEALHCTLMSNGGGWIEVQIRSERMNEIAEKGIAAHWIYKRHKDENKVEDIKSDDGKNISKGNKNDGIDVNKKDNDKKEKYEDKEDEKEIATWLNMVRDVLENPDPNALVFLDKFHNTLLDQEIYVFTPKGESKVLPKGSTALDFAYLIHSHIGNKAIAAKINLKLSPLSTVLRNGDQVEIITADSQKPQVEWLQFLKTSRAQNHVYDALKEEIHDSIRKGQEMLEKELAKFGIVPQKKVLTKLLKEYDLKTKEELYNAIATGIITLDELSKVLRKNTEKKNVIYWTLKFLKNSSKGSDSENIEDDESKMSNEDILNALLKDKFDANRDFIINDKDNREVKNKLKSSISYRIADCCYPIPGDTIVGFLKDDGEVEVHKKTCPIAMNLASVHGDRIINAKWSKHTVDSFLARVTILGNDRMGILSELSKVITLMLDINIRKISIATHDGIFEGYVDCYVKTTEDLNILIEHIRKIKGIEKVTRTDVVED